MLQEVVRKSDPFVRISRVCPDGSRIPVFKTEVVKNNLNPLFAPFSLSLQRLANGDKDRPLSFEVFDWNPIGAHALIGTAIASVAELLRR